MSIGLLFEAVLPEWYDPMTYTIAKLMDHSQMKLISADSGPIQNVNANDSDTTSMCHVAITWPNHVW